MPGCWRGCQPGKAARSLDQRSGSTSITWHKESRPKVTSRSQEERWMKRYAWAMLGLGLWVAGMEGGTRWALGQTPPPTIGPQQNRSFNPATTIPFKVSGELFLKGHRPVVSLKIYNVLAQLVAIPILRGSGKALDSLALSCPTTMGCAYSAYWDGYVGNTGKQAMSGVYIYQLVIDGKRVTRKIVVK